ncbi:MAG: glycosyltransferase family 4 protein [Eubacteriales bacterium]|nr:glycosyltransferase family 4 protein [Eubacteriales bacterium]
MRFLYVAPRYHTNQVPIMRGLKREGHEVCFLSQYAGSVEDYSDVTPVVVGYSRIFLFLDACYVKWIGKWDKKAKDRKIKCGFPAMGKLASNIRDFKPDVAILRERSAYSICAYLICRRYHIPAILYNQSPLWEDRIKNDLPHKLVRMITPKVRMTPVYGKSGKEKVIEPGAAFVPFVMEPVLSADKRIWQKDGVTHIFCIGKYEQRKNQRMMIEAVGTLLKEYKLHLTIAGECSTDAHCVYYHELEKYVCMHNLDNHVTLLKNLSRTRIDEQYRNADLFVIPSTLEPASISQLEAMAYSLPVICSDTNGTACYVENGENGWVFRDNNREALIQALGKILSSPGKMKLMGEKSYQLIVEKYQIEAYLAGIRRLLENLRHKEA